MTRVSDTWSGSFEFACNSKACAPPPVGTGGSSSSGAPSVSGYRKGDKFVDRKHGPVTVIDVRRGSGKEGPKNYDIVKAETSSGKRVTIAARAGAKRPDNFDKLNPWQKVSRMKKEGRFDPDSDDEYDALKDFKREAGYTRGSRMDKRY